MAEADTDLDESIASEAYQYSVSRHETKHERCKHSEGRFKALSLFRTCRQVYQEAALLPFRLNSFSIHRGGTLFEFLNGLIPSQQRAIRQITIVCTGSPSTLSTTLIQKLAGLRSLTLLGRLKCGPCRLGHGDVDRDVKVEDECYGRIMVSARRLPIERAKLYLVPGACWPQVKEGRTLEFWEKSQEWCRSMERMLEGKREEEEQTSGMEQNAL